MTIKDYISDKLGSLGLTLTAADWSDIGKAISLTAEDTDENLALAWRAAAANVLPFYVSVAKEWVKENGFEISFNANGLIRFYKWLCDYYGIDGSNVLGGESTIEDISDMY
jgi:hypothetical protein